MQLAKLTIPKILNTLRRFFFTRKKGCCQAILFFLLLQPLFVFSQDNSPYSRYGIGDLVPPLHINSRGMGGISAGFTDVISINFSNPASYSSFQAIREQTSKKLVMGRAILDLGLNIDNRTLYEPSSKKEFGSTNAFFSYVQVGVPLRKNWGLSFGLKPISRISYNMIREERLKDPSTGNVIDSSITTFTGTGGVFSFSAGTGIAIFDKDKGNGAQQKLSVGLNAHYLFGSKDYSTRRGLINDSIDYYQANFETRTTVSSVFFDAGLQFKTPLNIARNISLTLGAFGNWGQKLNANQDRLRETFSYDINVGNVRLDSVSDIRDIKGKLEMPVSYTVGFVIQKPSIINKESGWLFGADFSQQKWDNYRFYGQRDSVQNSWMLKVGAQFTPIPKRNYFSNINYRVGFFTGPDYIKVGKKLSQIGGSFGLGLPIAISRQAPNQITMINMSFEYGRRGNDQNILSETLFRAAIGFSLSDFWFIKRKYD